MSCLKYVVLLGVLFISGFSISSARSEEAASAGKPLLYGIHVGQNSDFWRQAGVGAAKAAEELGYDVLYRGAAQTDTQRQREIFNIALESGAKGIFIAPNSAERAEDILHAKEKNVPVVYFDRSMGDNPPVISFIGTDNYAAGKLAGQELIKKMGKDAPVKVVVFRMDATVVPTTQREDGFIDEVKAAGYEVVATPYVSSEIGEARSRIKNFLSDASQPEFQAIFTPSEYCAVATILTLQMMNKTKDYVHIGFDAGETIEKAIETGDMYGTIVQKPYEMGYYSVQALDSAIKGKPVKPFIESPVLFLSGENLEQYRSSNL